MCLVRIWPHGTDAYQYFINKYAPTKSMYSNMSIHVQHCLYVMQTLEVSCITFGVTVLVHFVILSEAFSQVSCDSLAAVTLATKFNYKVACACKLSHSFLSCWLMTK